MPLRIVWFSLLLCAWTQHAAAQYKLPTVDEALNLSAKTGKPIFAMAGQKT